VVIRFAGDSGDGMQLAGLQFTDASAILGNDVRTLPDYPSEIRAPAGTVAGVSGFQVQFASHDIFTPGDEVDTLVAMNPAALKANLRALRTGATILVNQDAFTPAELKKAGYESSPLADNTLANYRVIAVPVDTLNSKAVEGAGLTPKQADLCKNFFALGLVFWLYDRPLDTTIKYIQKKFAAKNPAIAAADTATLKAGYNYGETSELFAQQYQVSKARLAPGKYRKILGNEAVALGLVTAARLAGKELFYPSYPITPASDILHELANLKHFNVQTFQAEDEICAMGAAIGAAFGGAIAATGTSGPGLALKSEAIGLAVMTELPVVIVDVQRGGPSTGLPTKTEQSDLLQSYCGRHGDCPLPVIAASSPADCFSAAIEAVTLATRYMTPVILLTDGYIANGSEPWRIPDVATFSKIKVQHPTAASFPNGFLPYQRDLDGARPWAIPGTPGLEHRIGGLEKQDVTGAVSHDPQNHERMTQLRAAKIAGIHAVGEKYLWTGRRSGDVLLVGWGGTYGAIRSAAMELANQGHLVAACQLRYLNPLPAELGAMFKKFRHVICAELNTGQLKLLLRSQLQMDIQGYNKVQGQPFTTGEIVRAVRSVLAKEEAAVSFEKSKSLKEIKE
jgi:2-oxoglutarate ferredoxin oxidoreductase subunit alpha